MYSFKEDLATLFTVTLFWYATEMSEEYHAEAA
jgi:hypothetical protein